MQRNLLLSNKILEKHFLEKRQTCSTKANSQFDMNNDDPPNSPLFQTLLVIIIKKNCIFFLKNKIM
jgi:hypothetical protein